MAGRRDFGKFAACTIKSDYPRTSAASAPMVANLEVPTIWLVVGFET